MTPGLRSLFEGTVEPLLELVEVREEMAFWKGCAAEREERVEEALRELNKAMMDLQGLMPSAPEYRDKVDAKESCEDEVALMEEERDELKAKVAVLQAKIDAIVKRPEVARALLELEAPLVPNTETSATPVSLGSGSVAAIALRLDAPPSDPKRPRVDAGQQPHRSLALPLAILTGDNHDVATAVLDCLDVKSALRGIGSASHALRSAVKAATPRLGIMDAGAPASMPRLEEYPRLVHLFLHDRRTLNRYGASIAELGLQARLHSIRLDSAEGVLKHAWPQLRSLELGGSAPVRALLDKMMADPTVVFPKLEALSVLILRAEIVTKINALLDRGAFPSLTALAPSSGWKAVHIKSSGQAFTQACDLVCRVPNTTSLQFGAWSTPSRILAPFTELLGGGGLPMLKYVFHMLLWDVCDFYHRLDN